MKVAGIGETGVARCASCLALFEYIGNGYYIPVDCPCCSARREQRAPRPLTQEEKDLIAILEKMINI